MQVITAANDASTGRERRLTAAPAPSARRRIGGAVVALACVVVLIELVERFDAVPVLGLLVMGAAGLAMVIRPELATLVTIFLLYINAPAILTQQHDVPEFAAGAFILLLGIPIVHFLLIRRQSLRSDGAFALMVVFLGTVVLSSLEAVDVDIAMARVLGFALEGLLLYWLVINAIRDLSTLRRVIWVLLLAGSLVSTLCLYQDLTGSYDQEFGGLAYRNYDPSRDGIVDQDRDKRGKYDRAQGPVNEPNRFAQIMIVLLPLAAYLYRRSRSPLQRLSIAGMSMLILVGIALTLSRGAIVALAFMVGALVYLKWFRGGWVLLAVGLAVLVVPLITPFYLDRVNSLANVVYLFDHDDGAPQTDGAMRGRATEMLAALNVFRDHPILGVGPGQFAPFYVLPYSENPDIKFRDLRGARRAHTLYLELAAENGLVGLLVFMTIVALLIRKLWQARHRWLDDRPELADLVTACTLSLLTYLWTAIFLHLSYQRYYWFLLAFSSAAVRIAGASGSQHGRGPAHEETSPRVCGQSR